MSIEDLPEAVRIPGYAALGLGDVAVSRAREAADDARTRARVSVTRAWARIEELPADLADLGGTLTAEDFVRLGQSYVASTRHVWTGLVARGRATYTRLLGEQAPDAGPAVASRASDVIRRSA